MSIDGERVYVYSDVSLLLGRNKTGVFDLKVKRDGQTVTLKDFPMERAEYTDQQGQTYTGFGLMFGAEEATVGSRLRYSWNNAVDFVRIVRLSLQMLVTGEAGLKDVSGRWASSPPSRTWANRRRAPRRRWRTSPIWRRCWR